MTHRWSGWPGAYCLDCGSEDYLESAIVCDDCDIRCAPDHDATDERCALHEAWADAMSTCPPDPAKVKVVNAMMEAM